MVAINYELVIKAILVPLKEGLVPSADKETAERLKDNYIKPVPFFKGAFMALILALPFWSVLFWFILT
jgi:hypothetical protein